jgi:hypothetical protein
MSDPPTLFALTFPILLHHLPHLHVRALSSIPPKLANLLLNRPEISPQTLRYILIYLRANATYIEIPYSITLLLRKTVRGKHITHLATNEAGVKKIAKYVQSLAPVVPHLRSLKMTQLKDIKCISSFEQLQYLELVSSEATSEQIRVMISSLHSLRGLSLIRCKNLAENKEDGIKKEVPDNEEAQYPELIYLNISFCTIDDSWLSIIRKHWMRSLQVLKLDNNLRCDFNRLFLDGEIAMYAHLGSVSISSLSNLRGLVRYCPRLSLLDLSGCEELHHEDVSRIMDLLSSTSVKYLRTHENGSLTQLKNLTLYGMPLENERTDLPLVFKEGFDIRKWSLPDIPW